ncbi:DUF1289 domain-containing protein [Agaribacter marinus]|uniref:DUF1289 domain-containing protein n=1 Tax=Agaribacter marinus TaxID=1431249 RepID=UPI0024E0BF1D|nr:DUF1289 domain-containing protein [Agaribacter marinus]
MNVSDSINSPCIRNCCLNDENICIGCFRSLQDITQWSNASDAEKIEILRSVARRREERNKLF